MVFSYVIEFFLSRITEEKRKKKRENKRKKKKKKLKRELPNTKRKCLRKGKKLPFILLALELFVG